MDKAGVGLPIISLFVVSLGGLVGGARAADAVPFFKADPKPVMYGPIPLFMPEPTPMMYGPVLPDPTAPECGIDDRACIGRHDERVLSLAASSHERQECAQSTRPEACYDAFDMMEGDFVPKQDPIVNDPCAWVVLVDHNVATLSSRKLGITKRVLNKGWKARTFIGACNVKSIAPEQPVAIIPLPAWTVRKGQPAAAAAPRVVTVVPVPVNAAPGPTRPAVSAPTAPAISAPSAPATSIATAPTMPAPSRPSPAAPPVLQPPPPPAAGAPGATRPPPFARSATVSDAASTPPR